MHDSVNEICFTMNIIRFFDLYFQFYSDFIYISTKYLH